MWPYNGFDINYWIDGLNGKSALYSAVTAGQAATVVYLIEHGATMPEEMVRQSNLFYFGAADLEVLKPLLELYLLSPRDKKSD